MKQHEELLEEAVNLINNYFHSDLHADSCLERLEKSEISEKLKNKYDYYGIIADLEYIRGKR